jgi:SAM-dependent methyltransferase
MLASEKATCILCGPARSLPLPLRGEPRFRFCLGCGLVYQSPRPTEEALASHYSESYYGAAEYPVGDISARSATIADWLAPSLSPNSLVVEPGCGTGSNLDAIRRRSGCRVIGVEPSARMIAYARTTFGLDNAQGTIADLPTVLGSQKPAAVVFSHVLEHLYDPLAALSIIRAVIGDRGLVLIEVPNIQHPNGAKRLRGWFSVEHLTYFSPTTLAALVVRAGFVTVRSESADSVRILVRPGSGGHAARDARRELGLLLRASTRHAISYWGGRVRRVLP